ncbi:MAG: hypothetical protein ACE14M_05110 [Terriglobales bacterium]
MSTQATPPEVVAPIPIEPLPPLPAEEMTVANSTAAELRQAMRDEETRANAATGEPWQFDVQPDGHCTLTLESGERFIADSPNQLIERLAKSKLDATNYIRELRASKGLPPEDPAAQQQLDTSQSEPQQQQPAPAEPQIDPADAELSNYLAELVASNPAVSQRVLASAMGVPAEQLQGVLNMLGQTVQTAQEWQVERAWMDFNRSCPDYADTPQNAAILVEYFPEAVQQGRRFPTVEEMQTGWARALYEGKAIPAPRQQPQQPQNNVRLGAALIPSAQGAQPSVQDAYNMPMNELAKLVREGGQ